MLPMNPQVNDRARKRAKSHAVGTFTRGADGRIARSMDGAERYHTIVWVRRRAR